MTSRNIKLGVPNEEGQLRMMFSQGGPRQGAGRKGIGVTKKVSLTLPEALWAKFEQRSEALAVSKSELLREIVQGYFGATAGEGE